MATPPLSRPDTEALGLSRHEPLATAKRSETSRFFGCLLSGVREFVCAASRATTKARETKPWAKERT